MFNNVNYTLRWLERCKEALQKDPDSDLQDYTHQNISGGIRGWEEWVSNVYFEPATPQERYLQTEVLNVLLVAYKNALSKARSTTAKEWGLFECMPVVEAYRLAIMIGKISPLHIAQMKTQINQCCNLLGETFHRLDSNALFSGLLPHEIVW